VIGKIKMCLKKYVIFTFSNSEAFERLKSQLLEFKDKNISGVIYIINRISYEYSLCRKTCSYSELLDLAKTHLDDDDISKICFGSWASFRDASNYVKGKDVFGKVEIEMR